MLRIPDRVAPGVKRPVVGPEVAWSAGVLAFALVMLSGLSFAGGLWWVIDLTAAFRVHYALAGLVLGVVLLLARRHAAAAVCLALAVLHAVMVVPLYVDEPAPPVADGDRLEVTVLNTKLRGADPDRVIDHLRVGGPDLVVLLATSDRWADAMDQADIPYRIAMSRPSGTSLETLVLARRDVPASARLFRVSEGSGRGLAVAVSTQLDGQPVELLALHPPSPMTPARARQNSDQLAAAALWSMTRDEARIVVGDLNTTPWSPTFRALLRETELVDSQRGFGLQATWPATLGPLGLPIDHVLHSAELTTVDRSVGPGWGSDHRSVTVTLARTASK